MLGSKVNEYLAFRQKIRDLESDIRSVYRPTPEGEKIRSESERELFAEAREFNNSLGVDSSNVKNVQKKYLAQGRSALEKAMNITEAPDANLTSTEFSKRKSMVGWTAEYPPYDSYWGSEYRWSSGGSQIVSHSENAVTGDIECKSWMQLYGASSDDMSRTDAYSEILVWFQMPSTGFVNAIFTLKCMETPHSGYVHDEGGISDAYIVQNSACYLGLSQPQGGRVFHTLMHYFRETDGWNIDWSGNVASPYQPKYIDLTYSDKKFLQYKWVLVAIGIRDYHYANVNDMEFDMYMKNHWTVTEVLLRSTGG